MLLKARDLGVKVGGHLILEGISLNVEPGQIIGLIGHNGSGKSTLLKLLARQLAPSSGNLMLDGREYREWSARLFSRRVGYLPQHLPPSQGLTVRELVRFGRYPWRGLLRRLDTEDESRVQDALVRTDVLAMSERTVDDLSGGERQRVWLAMLLALDTRYLMLDEPTSALDLAHQSQVLRLLRRLADDGGLGIVLVLHDLNMAAHYCDRLVALKRGRLLTAGPPAELMSSEMLERIYDVPMTVVPRPDAKSALAVVSA